MQKVVDNFKQYICIISIVLAVCILLTYSLSYFMVNTGNKRVAEMYLGELQYSITIDGSATNVVTAPVGESIIDLAITGITEINTYYKLLYTYSGIGITVTYFDKTQDTSGVSTTYDLPGDSLTVKGTKKLKLKINNTSTAGKTVIFKVSGGYSTNTLSDVVVPSGYNQISLTTQYSNTYFCTTSSTLTDGLEYTNSGLTYKYKWQINPNSSTGWGAMSVDGWGVKLTDLTSTSAFSGKLCTYINNKPIKSTAYTFYNSKASTINLIYFDTHNVINMNSMFFNSKATSLNVSGFDTGNVTNMGSMFGLTSATTITGLNEFDTSNVTTMVSMFYNAKATTLDLSGFDTSNVTSMYAMFWASSATSINLSNIDTSSVTNMSMMFANSNATSLDLSSFNTRNVTEMNSMFSDCKVTSLNLSNFNISKVTTMKNMFANTVVGTLDLSSFELNSSVSLTEMFNGTRATVGYAKTQAIADKFNDSSVTSIPSTLFFIVKGAKTNAGVYVKNMKPTGLESTARDGLYRFVGTSNNYANMGGVTYRIIGITDNSTINTNLGLKQNQLKLIKATPIGTKAWEADRTTDNPWGSDDNDMYYYLNNTLINNTSYIPTAWKNRISSVNWYVGDAASASLASSLASLERGTTTSSTSKVGLMYFSDFYYSDAAGGTNCYSTACTSSWLYSSSYEQWSMTRRGHINNLGYYTWTVGTDGKAFNERVAATTIYYSPVFYLDQSVAITSGTGTSSNPFILDVNKNTYTAELQLNGETVGTYEVEKGSNLTTKIPTNNSIRMKSCDNASISTVENSGQGNSTIYVTSITRDTVCQMYYSLV